MFGCNNQDLVFDYLGFIEIFTTMIKRTLKEIKVDANAIVYKYMEVDCYF